MILGLAYLLCLVSVPLFGGRLGALASLRLRRPWLAFLAIAIQILIVSVIPGAVGALGEPLHLVSYALLGAFAWSNRRLVGVPVIAFGGLLNVLAITANGGVMPADPDALRAAGLAGASGEFANSAPVADPKLAFLGDVIATPGSLPVSNVYSVGDLLILVGAFVLVHVACGSRLVPRRVRPAHAEPVSAVAGAAGADPEPAPAR